MPILFAGSEEEAFTTVVPPERTVTVSKYDATYTPNGALYFDTGKFGEVYCEFDAQTEFWVHALVIINNVIFNGGNGIVIGNGASGLIRFGQPTSTARTDWQYYNGTAYTDISTGVMADNVLQEVDIHVKIDGTVGEFNLYLDGVLADSFSGNTLITGRETCNRITLTHAGEMTVSQLIVSTTSTLGYKLETIAYDAAGTTNDWTGAYTDIDDLVITDDSDVVNTATANDVFTFGTETPTVPANFAIKAVVNSFECTIGSAGPQNLQFVTRSNSVDYTSANVTGLSLSKGPIAQIQETDPDTGTTWEAADIGSAEFGLKAIT